jgi:hypothetical protein
MIGKIGRFSIFHLMAIILLVAIDCGLLRASWETSFFVLFLMILPTLNVILLGLPRLRSGRRGRGFWIGFDTVGVVLVSLLTFSYFLNPVITFWPLIWLREHDWISEKTTVLFLIAIAVVMTIYALPQLLLASFVGWFCDGYRLVIVHHPRSTDSVPSTSAVES